MPSASQRTEYDDLSQSPKIQPLPLAIHTCDRVRPIHRLRGAGQKYYAGDIAGAIDSSNNAKTWAWVSFGVGLGLALLYYSSSARSCSAPPHHDGQVGTHGLGTGCEAGRWAVATLAGRTSRTTAARPVWIWLLIDAVLTFWLVRNRPSETLSPP